MSESIKIERIGDATLYLGDCLEIFPILDQVDAVITDPPYGIGWTCGSWADSKSEYPIFMRQVVSAINKTMPCGWAFVFQSMSNVCRFHEWFPESWRIFAACKNFAQIRPTGIWHSWDPVVFWRNGPSNKPESNYIYRDYHIGNVAGSFGENIGHPCPRPIDTMLHIVQISTSSNAVVLDPFMGSGATGIACAQLGRKFIGIEIDPKYFEIACERISVAQSQHRLCLEVDEMPEQFKIA